MYIYIIYIIQYTRASSGDTALSGCEGVDFMTLSGGGQGCRDDIIAHTSSELPCGVN